MFSAAATSKSLFSSSNDQVVEALKSLEDFHIGEWTGVATSFTVTNDVMAGVVQRKTSAPYTVSVNFGVNGKSEYFLTEAITVGEESCQRRIALSNCNMDVDSVDASYSLDTTLPDFPPALAGTQKLLHFGIEHCLGINGISRSRCFAFYGADEQLSRIVVCHEDRVVVLAETATTTTAEKQQPINHLLTLLKEMKSEVDRLVDRITGNGTQQNDKNIKVEMNNGSFIAGQQQEMNPLDLLREKTAAAGGSGTTDDTDDDLLSPHFIGLLELCAGTWVGDSVIRDVPMVPTSPMQQKGFGTTATTSGSASRSQQPDKVPFGSWTMGVQKMTWRWMWNFGEEIRQVIDVGRAMGAPLSDPLAKGSMSGSVCVNEGMSRRVPKDERMVCIDWEGDNVGFLCGSVSIQVPRFLKFDWTRRVRPFYTEFAVYESAMGKLSDTADDSSEGAAQLPTVICSKIARVYNYEGKLKQGVTSFFIYKRFGYTV